MVAVTIWIVLWMGLLMLVVICSIQEWFKRHGKG